MKLIFVCCLLFVVSGFVLAQSKEEKLQQLRIRENIKVTEVEPNLLKLEYPNGKILYKNISDYQSPITDNLDYPPTYDSTIIDLTTIDTTLYYQKYSFWQEVPIHNWDFEYLRIGDVNNNRKPELYGTRKFFQSDFEPITVYELNNSEMFEDVFQYDSVFRARSIYDVDRDSKEEVLLTLPPIYDTVGNQQRFFSKENDTSLATQLNFTFTYYGVQPNVGAQLSDITLGDFDSDGYTDLIFAHSGYPDVHIFEYNPVLNNFDSVYRFDVFEQPPWGNSGFSIGDFDLDGKTDMVFGTGKGAVYVIENEGDNQYTNSWVDSIDSYHAYVHTCNNDIDKNGKPEFWVLGDAYYNGIGTTRITIFETNGDNSYYAVGRVDLVGVFSFYAGTMQAVDIDNDGTEEIAICIDENFLILKFNGSQDLHTYEVYYIKKNELNTSKEWQTYFGATMYDLQNDGSAEILISTAHTINTQPNVISRGVTKIYRPDSTTNVNDEEILPISNKLFQNYPNPFNSSTSVKFEINLLSTVSIRLFNVLGKEIKQLLHENLPAGEYSIQWDGKDNKGNLLTSGIYFIQMIAGNYQKIIKTILLK